MNRDNRVKPLFVKMGRDDIEALCKRKGWSIIPSEMVESSIDDIPYDQFWVAEYNENDENRPYIVTKTENGLEFESCSPNFMMHCVILKEERTITVEVRDSLENMKRAMELVDNEKEAQKINDIICALSVLSHGREISDAKLSREHKDTSL